MRKSDMVWSWRGFCVLPASWLTPNVLRSNKQTNKQSEKMERFHQPTFITVTQQGQSGPSLFLSPPSPHHTRIDSFPKGNTFSCTKIPSFFYFSSLTAAELSQWRLKPLANCRETRHLGLGKSFYLFRAYFKGKCNAKNVLSLLTKKAGHGNHINKG